MSIVYLKNVTAKYPKINRPYRFDSEAGKSVPCGAFDDGAEYVINFETDDVTQMSQVHKLLKDAYREFQSNNKKAPKEPMSMPFVKNDETGLIEGKARIKAAYGTEATRKPAQIDSKRKKLPDDFRLTTGSIVNIKAKAVPYSTGMNAGVSLRLMAVQVVRFEEESDTAGFDEIEDGFSVSESSDIAPDLEDDIPFD